MKTFSIHYKKGERFVVKVEPINPRAPATAPKKVIPVIIPCDMDKSQLYQYKTKRVAKLIKNLEKLTGLDYFWY